MEEEVTDTKHQYSIGFDEWFAEGGGYGPYELLKDAWSAGALRMEKVKDAAYNPAHVRKLRRIARLELELRVRKDVHRDDYNRAALLISGLKHIQTVGRVEASTGAQCAGIATETLAEALQSWKDK